MVFYSNAYAKNKPSFPPQGSRMNVSNKVPKTIKSINSINFILTFTHYLPKMSLKYI